MTKAKKFYWLKLKENFFMQKEIKKLRRIAGGDTYTIIYLKMQLLSIKNDGILHYDGTEDSLEEQLALELDEDIDNVVVTLSFLKANKLIEEINPDDYLLNKAVENIGKEGESAERMRALRKREKERASLCDSNVQNSDTEKEKEIEKEIEKDKRVEIDCKEVETSTKKHSRNFIKPSVEEIMTYCNERGNNIDPQNFYDFYESKGWYVGKNKMKNWKAAVRTWEKNNTNGCNNRGGRYKSTAEKQDEAYGMMENWANGKNQNENEFEYPSYPNEIDF